MQSEDTWMELHVLRDHGWSIAALAREFGLNWRTARRYANAGAPPRYRPRVRPAELSAAGLAHVSRRLAACPDLRATVLHRERLLTLRMAQRDPVWRGLWDHWRKSQFRGNEVWRCRSIRPLN